MKADTSSAAQARRDRGFPASLRLHLGILLVLVFACGLLAGLLWTRVTGEPTDLVPVPDRIFFERFSHDFGLGPAQRATLHLILQEKAKRKRQWWTDRMQRTLTAAQRDELLLIDRVADRRIRTLLSEDQRRTYDAWTERE